MSKTNCEMVVHLFNDEKFVDTAIEHFEKSAPGCNLYLIFVDGDDSFIHVKTKDNVFAFDKRMLNSQLLFLDRVDFNILYVHYLDYQKAKLIIHLKAQYVFKLVWFFWGADGFSLQRFDKLLYQPKTSKIKLGGVYEYFKRNIHIPLKILEKSGLYVKDYRNPNLSIIRVIESFVDYIIPVVPDDYHLFKGHYKVNAQMLDWNYLSIEQMLRNNLNQKVLGDNILLGNSATKTNNHIEVIDFLSLMNLRERKVYVPLSYGNMKYRDFIVDYGKRKLGENFIPLVDFMSLENYNKILLSCGTVIMNHNRQQAMGNIISTIWLGAKIYLNRQSTVFGYLEDINVKVYDISSLQTELDVCLEEDEILKNRTSLNKHWGAEAISIKTDNLNLLLKKAI